MGFLFGSDGQNPEAFRGPGWQNQGELLNQLFIGNIVGANPQLGAMANANITNLEGQLRGLNEQLAQAGAPSAQNFQRYGIQQQINAVNQQLANERRLAGTVNAAGQSGQYGFTPGQAIGGQMQSNVGDIPALTFEQRTPYQFNVQQPGFNYNLTPFNAQQAVGDAFTPQAERIQNILNRQGMLEDQAIREDLNRRGLLTSGATTEALAQRRERTGDALSNALLGLAGQQAQSQLGAYQYQNQAQLAQQQAQQQEAARRQQLDYDRQLNQAAEIFRQQGATDQQALSMASQALQQRQLGFNQNLQGRQQALQEFGVQNQLQRQPIDDLLRLYSFSTGAQQGYDAQPGLLQGLAGGVGQGLGAAAGGAMFCLPKGTEIETDDGSIKVEEAKVGDKVKGGTIIATSSRRRFDGHAFYKHIFKAGTVVMSDGHPYFDELASKEIAFHDSPNTYDILTDSGYYFVNGVKLGSTIGGYNG